MLRFRSFVAHSLRKGRAFLVGDAAHTVPPTGAKGMNLAINDVRLLHAGLAAFYRGEGEELLDQYEEKALHRIWRAQHFSWWMTSMLHSTPDASDFDRRRQLGERRLVGRRQHLPRRGVHRLAVRLTPEPGAGRLGGVSARSAPPGGTVTLSSSTKGARMDEAVSRDLADSPLGDDIEFLTARARSLGSEVANRALDPLGLRVRSYSLLACARAEYRPTQRRLADFLRLDPSQVVALVDGLEQSGLVRREADPDDRRSKIVIATAAGEALLVEADAAIAGAQEVTLAALTPGERGTLRTLLRRIALPQEP